MGRLKAFTETCLVPVVGNFKALKRISISQRSALANSIKEFDSYTVWLQMHAYLYLRNVNISNS